MLLLEFVNVESAQAQVEATEYRNTIPAELVVLVSKRGALAGQRFYPGEPDGEDVDFAECKALIESIPNIPPIATRVVEVGEVEYMPALFAWMLTALGEGEHDYTGVDEGELAFVTA